VSEEGRFLVDEVFITIMEINRNYNLRTDNTKNLIYYLFISQLGDRLS
jgi:hypothetical protein